jgi:hypothetical protein
VDVSAGAAIDDGHTTIKVDDKSASRVIVNITTTQPVIAVYDDIPPEKSVTFRSVFPIS